MGALPPRVGHGSRGSPLSVRGAPYRGLWTRPPIARATTRAGIGSRGTPRAERAGVVTAASGGCRDRAMLDENLLSYFDFRDRLAGDLRRGLVRPNPAALVEHAAFCAGISHSLAADWVRRFLAGLQREAMSRRKRVA